MLRRALAFAAAAACLAPACAQAAGREWWVSPAGSDGAAGTRQAPLATVSAAWRRVPQGRALTAAYSIHLLPGRYPQASVPAYWEGRRGSPAAPVAVDAPDGGVTLPPMNVYRVSGMRLAGFRLEGGGDVFHCERCSGLRLDRMTVRGGRDRAQEAVKINQSSGVRITRSDISGAGDNAIDFVAVRHASVTGSRIHDAQDWCAYAKGGSADVTFSGNVISDCGTGGITAGQGTGLQFMQAPYLRYEAYRVAFISNTVRDTEGAAFGVQGGLHVRIAGNVAYRTGSRSHLLEVGFGSRSCDGRPGDEGRWRCQAYLDAGAWGATAVDDGTNYIRIPSRDVRITGNVLYNPPGFQSAWQQLSVAGALPPGPRGGVPAGARADDGLRIAGNVIWNGPPGMELGAGQDGCRPANPACNPAQLRRENRINTVQPAVRELGGGRLGSTPAPSAR